MHAVEANEAQLSISSERHGRVVHLYLTGDLDMATTPVLEEWLSDAEANENSAIVVDLEHVTFLDTSGLHSFIRASQRASRTGRDFSIARPTPVVRRILGVTDTTYLLDAKATD